MLKRPKLLCIIFLWISTGCASNTTNGIDISSISPSTATPANHNQSVTSEVSVSVQTTRVPTNISPEVVFSDTPTSIPSPSPSPLAINIPKECLNPNDPELIDPEFGIFGALGLVYEPSLEVPTDLQVVMFGGQPITKHVLLPSHQSIRVIGFSPNGSWFAYQVFSEDSPGGPPNQVIDLVSVDGELISTPIPLNDDETTGFWFSNWINDDLMLLLFNRPSGIVGADQQGFTVFNPFTGELFQHFLEDLPGWNGETTVYFSPDMSRAVYVGEEMQELSLILWDAVNQVLLWQRPFPNRYRIDKYGIGSNSGFGNLATWSPDSSKFIFTSEELVGESRIIYNSYSVNRDGELEQLLNSTSDPQEQVIYDGVWSPDMKFFAYLNDHYNSEEQEWSKTLMVYDFDLTQVFELCSGLYRHINEVLWSPDSKSLAFMSLIDQSTSLLILDIYSGEVASLGEVQNFIAAKWIDNNEWLIRE